LLIFTKYHNAEEFQRAGEMLLFCQCPEVVSWSVLGIDRWFAWSWFHRKSWKGHHEKEFNIVTEGQTISLHW